MTRVKNEINLVDVDTRRQDTRHERNSNLCLVVRMSSSFVSTVTFPLISDLANISICLSVRKSSTILLQRPHYILSTFAGHKAGKENLVFIAKFQFFPL